MPASVTYELGEGALRCAFNGRLDTAASLTIEGDLLARVAEAGGPVVFDMAGVDYVCSAFLRLCVVMAKRPAAFSMVHVEPAVKKVFKIAGFDGIMNIQ